ncbi:alanine/glycine:cation symporter family protein [Zobellella sp. DQSA1]|uniref:alanine/glycine:cation symporter family protein n=1 Tax=Zobellella sp. DQSA1 TaxID=3342386 RepID=UPI0035BFF629
MRVLFAGLMLLLMPAAFAQDKSGIDATINSIMEPIANIAVSIIFYTVSIAGAQIPLIVLWLAIAAIFFTFYFRFINFRALGHALKLIRGDYTDPRSSGEVSHFQALATALSSTIGLGNIAGVAVAISLGGPGATFWMILVGLFSMSTKFVECTLGVKYRNENPDGSISGGPMYYLSKGLAKRNMSGFGKFLAAFFAICMIGSTLGGGNMFQINQAYQQFVNVTGGEASFFADKAWLFGLVVAVVVGVVIIGGIKRIAHVTEVLVPFMGIVYLSATLVIIATHIGQVPAAFATIITGAFAPEGVAGGIIGVMIQGMRRATFSNEAGVGTAAIAHSAVRTKEPITEGLVALYEPFIDTVVICTATALVIIITGVYTQEGLDGVQLTSAAFATVIGWFPYLLAIIVILFALSTIIASSYYMVKASTYLFGESPRIELFLRLIFCGFTVIGATLQLGTVIDLTDALFFSMAIINIIGLYILAPEVKMDLDSYWLRLRSGEIRPYKASRTKAVLTNPTD